MISILSKITAAKRARVVRDKEVVSPSTALRMAEDVSRREPAMSFREGLEARMPYISVIAEMKRASPSAGVMDPDLDPAARARTYCESGAAGISVLTEEDHFKGSMDDLRSAAVVAHGHQTPVLQKDFVIDEYQICQARAASADTVLLIVAILDSVQYADLYAAATGLGMEPLVEVFDDEELEVALTAAEPKIVGINNRNLKTLQTSLEVFPRLASRIPGDVLKVAESGMKSSDDVRRMADAGAQAVLIGESLMKSERTTGLLSEMTGVAV